MRCRSCSATPRSRALRAACVWISRTPSPWQREPRSEHSGSSPLARRRAGVRSSPAWSKRSWASTGPWRQPRAGPGSSLLTCSAVDAGVAETYLEFVAAAAPLFPAQYLRTQTKWIRSLTRFSTPTCCCLCRSFLARISHSDERSRRVRRVNHSAVPCRDGQSRSGAVRQHRRTVSGSKICFYLERCEPE